MTYANKANRLFHLNSFSRKADILVYLDTVQQRGGDTNAANALDFVRKRMFSKEHGARDTVPHVVFFLTDGRSEDSAVTIKEANKLHKLGIYVFSISLGQFYSAREIYGIGSQPSEKFVFQVNDFVPLDTMKEMIMNCNVTRGQVRLRQRPTPTPSTTENDNTIDGDVNDSGRVGEGPGNENTDSANNNGNNNSDDDDEFGNPNGREEVGPGGFGGRGLAGGNELGSTGSRSQENGRNENPFGGNKAGVIDIDDDEDDLRIGLDETGNNYGFDDEGFDRNGYDEDGYNIDGYDKDGYDRDGYDRNGYGRNGYDRNGYDRNGYNRNGYDNDGYNKNGIGRDGYNRNGYDKDGLNVYGYDEDGYRRGYDRYGYDKEGYDKDGYDKNGFNKDGYDKNGYDKDGFDKNGLDKYGYDRNGFDKNGFDRNGNKKNENSIYDYDENGYDRNGFDRNNKDRYGNERNGAGNDRNSADNDRNDIDRNSADNDRNNAGSGNDRKDNDRNSANNDRDSAGNDRNDIDRNSAENDRNHNNRGGNSRNRHNRGKNRNRNNRGGNDRNVASNGRDGSDNDRDGSGNGRYGSGNGRGGAGNGRDGAGNGRYGSGNDRYGSGNGRDGAGNGRDGAGNDRDGAGNDIDGAGNGKDGAGNDRAGSGNGRDGAGNGRDDPYGNRKNDRSYNEIDDNRRHGSGYDSNLPDSIGGNNKHDGNVGVFDPSKNNGNAGKPWVPDPNNPHGNDRHSNNGGNFGSNPNGGLWPGNYKDYKDKTNQWKKENERKVVIHSTIKPDGDPYGFLPQGAYKCELQEDRDVQFVIDSNHAHGVDNMNLVQFMKNIVNSIDDCDHHLNVGVINECTEGGDGFVLGERTRSQLLQEFDNGISNNKKALTHHMRQSFQKQGRPGSKKIGIVIMDKKSDDMMKTLEHAQKSRQEGAELFVIGIGPHADPVELKAIASCPLDKHVYNVDTYKDLYLLTDFFVEHICKGGAMGPEHMESGEDPMRVLRSRLL